MRNFGTNYGIVDPDCPLNWDAPLNRGLIGNWASVPNAGWTGGNKLYDLVRGGKTPHDGTLTGSWWQSEAEPDGRGVYFTGGAYAACGSVPLDSDNWTISLTFRPKSVGAYMRFLAWYGDGPTIWLDSAVNKFGLVHSSTVDFRFPWTAAAGVKYHLLISRTGSRIAGYNSGVESYTDNSFSASYTLDTSFRLGVSDSPYPNAADAVIYCAKVWNRGLTRDEAAAEYEEYRTKANFNWIKRPSSYFFDVGGGGTFQAAWAVGSNVVLQSGAQ